MRLAQARGHIISRYNLERDLQVDLELRSAFDLLGVELLSPLALKDELVGFIALGKKESGGFFSVDDIDFLRAFANQSALSIANALAYREIQTLNAVLEERVSQRTEELSNSNLGLQVRLNRHTATCNGARRIFHGRKRWQPSEGSRPALRMK